MKDARPLFSPMDADVLELLHPAIARQSEQLIEIFDAIVALDRPGAELENDALSSLSLLVGAGAAALVGRLAERKRLPLPLAFDLARDSVLASMAHWYQQALQQASAGAAR